MASARPITSLVLEAVGIPEAEERAYRELLARPGVTTAELAREIELPRAQLQRVLSSLEAKGLVSRSAETPQRLMAAAPDVALEVLILRKQEELERARLAAAELATEFRKGLQSTSPPTLVEVISGQKAVAQRAIQLQRTAKREIIGFDTPPYASDDRSAAEIELDLLRRGVAHRAIYDRDALRHSGYLEILAELTEAGEEARMLDQVPIKLVIADRRLAIIPLRLDEPGVEDALLVHPSPLLEALVVLFETLWERAAPLRFGSQRDIAVGGRADWTTADRQLLALLSAGFQDKAIAHQLGVGFRTVQRQVKYLMDGLGATTRFQAGWVAAERLAAGDEGAAEAAERQGVA
ncbi:MAG: helix-turn-helix domain-containing protein [Gaiellaceae bacterium]